MDHHVAPQRPSGVIVDTASSVGDVSHDDTLGPAEPLDNVNDRATIHQESFGHLERNSRSSILLDLGYSLGNFEVVVGREEMGDGREEEGVRRHRVGEMVRGDGERGGGRTAGRGGGSSYEPLLWYFGGRRHR